MQMLARALLFFSISLSYLSPNAWADSRGNELAGWIDERGQDVFGKPPRKCDDLTFARRVYLDVTGRVPSVSELRDFQELGDDRREVLIDQLVYGEGPRGDIYKRLSAQTLSRQWRRVLLPPGTVVNGSAESLEAWLGDAFASRTPFDEIMRQLARATSVESAGGYYVLVGALPENYAGHLSRAALGVRIECAQCHDHPFVDWKQTDFWGLAAFYSDLARATNDPNASTMAKSAGSIEYEGVSYPAKFLWAGEALNQDGTALRSRLAQWLTSPENPYFAATAVNRFWQHLVGRGLYPDVENLDLASPSEREWLDEFGQRFSKIGFDVHVLVAAICKSSWYQAESIPAAGDIDAGDVDAKDPTGAVDASERFARNLKVISPEQVFDSLEQSLLLPVSRIDPSSSRWSGDRLQLVSRLSETTGATPEDYAAGIPQALLLMNGKMTSEAIDLERSRLLRAVVESPFFGHSDRIETLYLAVLTREPTSDEKAALSEYLDTKATEPARDRAYGEILWTLLNSPEFVLCR